MLNGSAAVLYAIFVWWFSTGLVLWAVRLPRYAQGWTLFFATLVMVAGLFGLASAARDTTIAGAYQAFTCALLIWAWQEIGFLQGLVTGPRKVPLTAGARGGARTAEAIGVVLYHELALVGSGAAVLAVSWGEANQVGLWTFGVLWVMRLSAKLNLFLGVPNRSESFLPDRLRYIASYFADKPINLLFPISVTGATAVIVLLAERIIDPAVPPGPTAGFLLVAALLALALVEHWMLVLPLPAEALWRWGLSGAPQTPSMPQTRSIGRHWSGTTRAGRPTAPAVGPLVDHTRPNHRRGS